MPKKAFGRFYSVPLDSVNRNSATGWFDMRITYSDASGNKLVQPISPAFHVEALAKIITLQNESTESAPIHYNTQGQRVEHPCSGQILIRRAGLYSTKIIIRK